MADSGPYNEKSLLTNSSEASFKSPKCCGPPFMVGLRFTWKKVVLGVGAYLVGSPNVVMPGQDASTTGYARFKIGEAGNEGQLTDFAQCAAGGELSCQSRGASENVVNSFLGTLLPTIARAERSKRAKAGVTCSRRR